MELACKRSTVYRASQLLCSWLVHACQLNLGEKSRAEKDREWEREREREPFRREEKKSILLISSPSSFIFLLFGRVALFVPGIKTKTKKNRNKSPTNSGRRVQTCCHVPASNSFGNGPTHSSSSSIYKAAFLWFSVFGETAPIIETLMFPLVERTERRTGGLLLNRMENCWLWNNNLSLRCCAFSCSVQTNACDQPKMSNIRVHRKNRERQSRQFKVGLREQKRGKKRYRPGNPALVDRFSTKRRGKWLTTASFFLS